MRAALLVAPLAVSLLTSSPASAVLAVGDIAIVGANSAGTDNFAFVALAAIPAGETISFTDSSWRGLGGSGGFRLDEHLSESPQDPAGPVVWTSPTGGVSAGTVVTITNDVLSAISASVGSVTGGAMALQSQGDQIFAFRETSTSPSMLFGVQFATDTNQPFGVSSTQLANTNNSTNIPPGLTLGSTMLALDYTAGVSTARGNIRYAGKTEFSGATLAEAAGQAKAAITTPANWESRNDIAYTTLTPNFTFTVTAIPEPSATLVGALLAGGLGMTVGRRPAPSA